MAYSDFTLDDLELKFGVTNHVGYFFDNIKPVPASSDLLEELEYVKTLPVRTEKAKSEWIVVPILKALRKRNDAYFTIYSGETLTADAKKGLKGECDFIIAKDIKTFGISYPILQIVEAKKNDIELGVPQCAAQLVGAKLFNEKKGVLLSKIYGCVTTGNEWLFMVLEDNKILIDSKVYYLTEIEKILGVFQTIIDYYKKELK